MSTAPPCLTLVTDYGLQAGFVGSLHAVAWSLLPGITVIDLDHSIPPGDVRLGALRLERLTRYVPATVHVGIVDPGVGGARRPVALRAGDHVYVGPDNGLLLFAADALGGVDEVVHLDDETCFLAPRAQTFDGRDVFVPAACHVLLRNSLAVRGSLGAVGSPIDPASLVRLERPRAERDGRDVLRAEVLQVDGFGNVQLSAGPGDLAALGWRRGERLRLAAGSGEVALELGTTFSDVAPGEGVLIVDSDGQLAYSVNLGRAAGGLGLGPGVTVTLRRDGSGRPATRRGRDPSPR